MVNAFEVDQGVEGVDAAQLLSWLIAMTDELVYATIN